MSDERWKNLDVKVYSPFPDDEAPDGWPTDFISVEDAIDLAEDRDKWKARAELAGSVVKAGLRP
jgi:hypothetical protein